MARQEIILGTPPAGLGGDPPRTASMKINAMTQELYDKHAALGTSASRNLTATFDEGLAGGGIGVLKQGDYGIGRPLSLRGMSDADIPIGRNTGVSFDYLGGGYPAGSNDGALLSMGYSNQYNFQLFGDWRTGNLYTRNTAAEQVKTKMWRRLLSAENAVEPIASGGIIERGTNNYGSFTKYADGTLVCFGQAQPILNAPANVTTPSVATIFAHPFVTRPSVEVSCSPTLNHDHYGVIGVNYGAADGLTRFQHYIRNGATVQTFVSYFIAVGFWK